MFNWVLGKKSAKTKGKPRKKRPGYEEAKVIAQKGDTEARRELATHDDLEPELLYYFATDDEPEVRRAVAENEGTPLQADVILAEDANDDVRYELARKIGRLVPQLSQDENESLTELAIQVLEILANDDLPRVRATIADELKHADNIPKHIVERLARDVEGIVSAPVLEYSPLLNDDDLLDIIASGIAGKALVAVGQRRDLPESVANAVYQTFDTEAVTALLNNDTAKISDNTLENIAESAEKRPEWHAPLVDRDNMPVRTVLRVAGFVSSAMVNLLMEKNQHLESEYIDELKKTVRKRIAKGDFADDEPEIEPAEDRARKMHDSGMLSEQVLMNAIEKGDKAFVRYGLILLSGLPKESVQKMLNTSSAKAVVALCWKADLSMEMAEVLQQKIARIQPKSLIRAKPDGGFPLSEDDIDWYLDFFL